MIAERTGTDAGPAVRGSLEYRFAADGDAAGRVRDALAGDLQGIEGGARLTVELLARALVAMCVPGEGGTVRLALSVGDEQVRVEVSGDGAGFRLPTRSREIDYFSLAPRAAAPPGWRSYLIDRLADDRGVDEDAGVAWVEVDHATDAARRLRSSRR